MQDVWAAYGQHPVLREVSLQVTEGARQAVVGPSGSGKSTLLKLLRGLLPAARGEIRTLGIDAGARMGRRLGAQVGYIPQNLGLVNNATTIDNALMGALHRIGPIRSWMGIFPAVEYQTASDALDAVGIGHLAERRAYQLSGGERRRLAVARTLVQRPRLLLADEFLSELDDATAQQVLAALAAAQRELGMTLIVVEHNLRVACSFCDRIAVLYNGCKIADLAGAEASEDRLRSLLQSGSGS